MCRDVEIVGVVHHPAGGPLVVTWRRVAGRLEAGHRVPVGEIAVDHDWPLRRHHRNRIEEHPAKLPNPFLGFGHILELHAGRRGHAADEPALAVGNRPGQPIVARLKPRRLSRHEPLGKLHPRFAGLPRGEHLSVIHLHVGDEPQPRLDGKLGAEVEHAGRGGIEPEAAHALGHLHHCLAGVQKRGHVAEQLQFARAFENDLHAVAQPHSHDARFDRQPAGGH